MQSKPITKDNGYILLQATTQIFYEDGHYRTFDIFAIDLYITAK